MMPSSMLLLPLLLSLPFCLPFSPPPVPARSVTSSSVTSPRPLLQVLPPQVLPPQVPARRPLAQPLYSALPTVPLPSIPPSAPLPMRADHDILLRCARGEKTERTPVW
jgi:hypothetical protein